MKIKLLILVSIVFLMMTTSISLWSKGREKQVTIDKYIKYLKKGSLEVMRFSARKLGDFKKTKAAKALIQALAYKDYSVRFFSKKSLVKIGDVAIPLLIEALKHRHHLIRSGSAEVLGRIKNPKAIAALSFTLENDKHYFVRASAVTALSLIGGQKTVVSVIKALKDRNWQVRSAAAKALGYLKNKKALVPLIKALKDKNSYVRLHAVAALGRMRNREAVPYLIKALRDNDAKTREMAAWSLGKIKDKASIRALLHSLGKDRNGNVRKEAREALLKMGYSSQQIDKVLKQY